MVMSIYYSNAALVVGPRTRPATGSMASEIMDHLKLKFIFCPPIINLCRILMVSVGLHISSNPLTNQIINHLTAIISLVYEGNPSHMYHPMTGSYSFSHLRPRIVFISSISSMGNWHTHASSSSKDQAPQNAQRSLIVPESIPSTASAAQHIGYAGSKAVAEQVLAFASTQHGIPTTILGVGQFADPIGPDNGAKWNTQEWFPLLVLQKRQQYKG
jgi:hypothetical protein